MNRIFKEFLLGTGQIFGLGSQPVKKRATLTKEEQAAQDLDKAAGKVLRSIRRAKERSSLVSSQIAPTSAIKQPVQKTTATPKRELKQEELTHV